MIETAFGIILSMVAVLAVVFTSAVVFVVVGLLIVSTSEHADESKEEVDNGE